MRFVAFAFSILMTVRAFPQAGAPPRARFEEVKTMISQGQFALAVPVIRELLKSSESPLLYNLLGFCYAQQGISDEAKINFRKAIQLKPDFKAAHNNLAGVCLLGGETREAIEELSAVVRIDPADAQALYRLGQAELARGSAAAALPHLESAHRLLPADAAIPLALARAQAIEGYRHKTGDPAQAVLELQKAIELDPQNADYILELSEVFLANYNAAAAVTLLSAATGRFPDAARMWFALGVSHLLDDKFAPAVTALKRSLELDPKLDQAYEVLARGYKDAGQWSELQETSQALIRLNPSNHSGYYYQAMALSRTDAGGGSVSAEIEPLLRKSSALDPSDPEVRYELAKVLLERHDQPAALRELEAAIHADPDFGPAYYQLYRLYRESGETEKSQQALKEYERLRAQRGQAIRKLLVEVRQRGERP
jgi:predicted Zn-dependent protease